MTKCVQSASLGVGLNPENSAPDRQCRLQRTKGHTKAVHNRGRAVLSAPDSYLTYCRGQRAENRHRVTERYRRVPRGNQKYQGVHRVTKKYPEVLKGTKRYQGYI